MRSFTFASALIAVSMSSALACRCAYELAGNIARADEIFVARLQTRTIIPGVPPQRWSTIEGTFKVSKTLKGPAQAEEVVLSTENGLTDCDLAMPVSQKFIVFKRHDDSHLYACSGIGVINDTQESELVPKIQAIVHLQERASSKK
jgi:hypothetical protein